MMLRLFLPLLFQLSLPSVILTSHYYPSCTFIQAKSYHVFNCQALNLISVPSAIPSHTLALLLTFNRIASVSHNSFPNLHHLQTLSLGSQVTSGTFSVGKLAFHCFPNLVSLDLGGNRNINLHPQAFEGLFRLEVLLLDYNGLDESVLESGLFKDLTSLKRLDLSFNQIRRIRPDPTFLKLSTISVLLLKLNKVSMLCGEELQSLEGRRLDLLDLSSNPLLFSKTQNCTNPFKNITLGILDVSSMAWNTQSTENFFRTISGTEVDHVKMRHMAALGSGFGFSNLKNPNKDTFSGLNSSNVQTLDLSKGFISHLVSQVFSPFAKLLSLDLSSNKISSISTGAFSGLNELVSLNLSGNLLGQLMSSSFQALEGTSLKILDLSSNYIGAIQYGSLGGLNALKSLNLRDNALKSIPPISLPSITFVLLKQNRISDIYGITSFCPNATVLDLSSNQLTDLKSLWDIMELRYLKYLSLGRNYISQCSFTSKTNISSSILHLDLSDNNLGMIWKSRHCGNIFMGLGNLEYLNLARNYILHLPENIFNGLSSLRTLDLSGNLFRNIQSGLFTGLTALKSLNLGRNSLVTLSPYAFGPLSSLESVDLSEITLVCDCSLMKYWNWLNETKVTVHLGTPEVSCMKLTPEVIETPLHSFINNCK